MKIFYKVKSVYKRIYRPVKRIYNRLIPELEEIINFKKAPCITVKKSKKLLGDVKVLKCTREEIC